MKSLRFIAATLLLVASAGQATVVTFDDVDPNRNYTTLDGLVFSNEPPAVGAFVIDASSLYGHVDLAQSGNNGVSMSNHGFLTMNLATGGLFNFESVYFGSTHALNDVQSIQVQGLRNGTQIYSALLGTSNTPTLFAANWTDIDSLKVKFSISSGYAVMDTLSYSVSPPPISPVPEPSALFLTLSGLGALGVAKKRQSRT